MTRRAPLVEEELFIISVHSISPAVFSGDRVAQYISFLCSVLSNIVLLSFFCWLLVDSGYENDRSYKRK